MCEYCDFKSTKCCIYKDSLTPDYYLELSTDMWDIYDGDFVYIKEWINYCPYCGRKLNNDE